MANISIAADFSEFPAGRIPDDGPNSGERFREELLVPLLNGTDEHIEINLDDTLGYGSSFLDEAFAGLLRINGFSLNQLKKRIRFIDSRIIYEPMIWKYIEEESNRAVRG